MAVGGLVVILDDIAATSKAVAANTVGIVGDDLALNANQVAGVDPKREVPVVLKVAKGSGINKVILAPILLGLGAVAPAAVTPLLMVGGTYLGYEGVEKVLHAVMHKKDQHKKSEAHHRPPMTAEEESKKIKGAVATDFVLSAEIMAMALAGSMGKPFLTQVGTMGVIGVAMTVGVYGAVLGIVKADDLALRMMQKKGDDLVSRATRGLGRAILKSVPPFMKLLSIAGTAAMFTVGGGILTHGIPALHHGIEALAHAAGPVAAIVPTLANVGVAAVAGLAVVGASGPAKKLAAHIAPPVQRVFAKIKDALPSFGKKAAPSVSPAPVVTPDAVAVQAAPLQKLPDSIVVKGVLPDMSGALADAAAGVKKPEAQAVLPPPPGVAPKVENQPGGMV